MSSSNIAVDVAVLQHWTCKFASFVHVRKDLRSSEESVKKRNLPSFLSRRNHPKICHPDSTQTSANLRAAFFFLLFYRVFFGCFSRFLAEVVFTAPFWSSDLHLRGTCSTLEFGSLALAWCLQHFGAWISHSTGICNILELGSLMVFASG